MANLLQIEKAKELGASAFELGMKRAPYMDNEMNKIIEGMSSQESLDLLKVWISAWDEKARGNARYGVRRSA